MTGTPAVAVWIGQAAFVCLLAGGWIVGELSTKLAAVFVVLLLIGGGVLPFFWPGAALLRAPLVAVLDIGLVFCIFGGDVRLT